MSAKWQQFCIGLNVLTPNRGQAIIWTCEDFTDTCVSLFACDQSGIATLPRLCEYTTHLWSGRLPSGRLITCKRIKIFSHDQAALWMILSVFSSHIPLIDTDRGNVHAKDQGQKSRSQRSKQILPQFEHVRTVTPVWIHIWQRNDAQSLKWHRKCALLFLAATKQLYEWCSPSVCLSVYPYVRTYVCTSVTPFWLCSHHHIIMKFSGVITNDRSDVHAKSQGQRSKVKVTEVNTPLNRFRTVTPVWIPIWWWNDAYRLVLLRRGALLFFEVIRQISRSHGSRIRRIWPRLGISRL